MICGVCGGEVRGYSGKLYGRPIKDWKHRSVPPGTEPHRPVLGTPVGLEELERAYRPVKEEAPKKPVVEEAGPPLVAPRPATAEELEESQSVTQIRRLLASHRWVEVEEPWYFQTAAGIEHFVVKARRRDLGMVATWRRRPGRSWELESGWRLAPGHTDQVGSEQLKSWITQRDERCPDCGRSSVVHTEEGECP